MAQTIQPGTILYSSWGYDQTNVDYYQVVSKSGRRVKVRPIASWTVSEGRGSDMVAPDVGNFTGPETTHIIGEHGITVGHQTAYPTEPGTAKHQTAFGWGH